MKIERLCLKNFRCYGKLEIDFHPRLTVIAGANGKGKSAIFDAIGLALSPYVEQFGLPGREIQESDVRRKPIYDEAGHLKAMEQRYPVEVKLTGTLENNSWISTLEQKQAAKAVREQQGMQIPKSLYPVISYYGTSRLWVDSGLLSEEVGLDKSELGYYECLEPSSSFQSFTGWLAHLSQSKDAAKRELYGAVVEAVENSLKSLDATDLYFNEKLGKLVLSQKYFGELLVNDLSDGVRCIMSLAADLAYRMVTLNPELGSKAIKEATGILLIDEVDMHLHPLWQQSILRDLTEAFPKVQFIVTTHSPQVLSTVAPESIRVLFWEKHKVYVKHVDFSLGAEAGRILQEIQQVSSRADYLPIVQDLQTYLKLVEEGKWDTEEAKMLRERLDSWSKGNEPALLRADMNIRLQQRRGHRP